MTTILKILTDKKFVGIETFGRPNRYYPLVKKEAYSGSFIKKLVEQYFDGSFSNVVSFPVEKNNLCTADLEVLLKQIKKQKK